MQGTVVQKAGIGDFLKGTPSQVVKELKLLAVPDLVRNLLNLGRNIAVGHENVRPAVIVEIHESNAPLHRSKAGAANLRVPGNVDETLFSLVSVEADRLTAEAAHYEIELPIAIEVSEVARHVAHFQARRIYRRAGDDADVFESAIMLVVVEIIRTHIVGDKKIGPAVVVVVAPDHAHAAAFLEIGNTGFFGYLFESTVAAIMKEERSFALLSRHFHGQAFVVERHCAGLRKFMNVGMHIAGHEQIEASIAIVVGPCGSHAESSARYVSAFGDVLEFTAAQIVVEDVVAVSGHVDVGQSIIVEISDRQSHSPAQDRETGGLRDVGEMESAVFSVLPIQRDHQIAALEISVDGGISDHRD